jgi:hypothetical protein
METPDKNQHTSKPKKAYHNPVIRYYGSVRTMTASTGMTSANSDGATSGGNKKTK